MRLTNTECGHCGKVGWIIVETDQMMEYLHCRGCGWVRYLSSADDKPVIHLNIKKQPAKPWHRKSLSEETIAERLAFGKVCRARIQELGLRMTDIARAHGIPHSTVHAVMAGRMGPEAMRKVGMALGISHPALPGAQ